MKIEFTAKKIGAWAGAVTGVVAVVIIGWNVYNHFMPKAEAIASHESLLALQKAGDTRVAEYDEIGFLENQIQLTLLEMKQLGMIAERRPLDIDEETTLDILKDKLSILRGRLQDLQAKMKGA